MSATYKLPNPNCKVCHGNHVNVFSKPVSRLEACKYCGDQPYPTGNFEAIMDNKGNVSAVKEDPKPVKPSKPLINTKIIKVTDSDPDSK